MNNPCNNMPYNYMQMPITNENMMMPMMPFNPMQNNDDILNRLNILERQIKRIEDRLTKLEASGNNYNYNISEPDNSMYMM